MKTATPLFELDGLTFGYPGRAPLFTDLDFRYFRGERLGLIGHNGTGKTTLLHVITGLIPPGSGTVRFRGEEMQGEKSFQKLRRKVGLLFQHADDQLFCPTVLEDVAFGPLNLGLSPDEAKEKALATLRMLGLTGFEDRITHKLSGGEKKLVSLAAVLAMNPDALLLDEPTNGLDPDTRERLVDILNGLPQGYIVISHDWDFIEKTTERVLSIENGAMVEDVTPRLHSHVHLHPMGEKPHDHR